VKTFSSLAYFIKRFYKFRALNAIWKDNAAINCTTVQYKISIPVNLDGSVILH
jgi:hypothetical protein